MERWLQIAFVCQAAGVSLAMEPGDWDNARPEAMTLLSILAAAVLFRLGRGVPTMSVDGLSVKEARDLAYAHEKVAHRLAVVAGMTAAGLVGLAVIGVAHRLVRLHLPADIVEFCSRSLTALLAVVLALTFCRAVVLVRGDLSSVRVQGRSMVASVRRRHVDEAAIAIRKAEESRPFEAPSNHGELIDER